MDSEANTAEAKTEDAISRRLTFEDDGNVDDMFRKQFVDCSFLLVLDLRKSRIDNLEKLELQTFSA